MLGSWRFYVTLLDNTRGIAGNNCPLLDVLCHYGPGADNRSFADYDVWSEERIRAYPCVISNLDRWLEKRHRWIFVIMGPSAEMGTV